MWWDGYGHGFHWMWIFPLIFFVLCALFLFRGAGGLMCGHKRHDREESAREILDRRFARGEISRDEYQGMRKDLEQAQPNGGLQARRPA